MEILQILTKLKTAGASEEQLQAAAYAIIPKTSSAAGFKRVGTVSDLVKNLQAGMKP